MVYLPTKLGHLWGFHAGKYTSTMDHLYLSMSVMDIWLVVEPYPSEKYESQCHNVNWDDYSQYVENMFQPANQI